MGRTVQRACGTVGLPTDPSQVRRAILDELVDRGDQTLFETAPAGGR